MGSTQSKLKIKVNQSKKKMYTYIYSFFYDIIYRRGREVSGFDEVQNSL